MADVILPACALRFTPVRSPGLGMPRALNGRLN